MQLSANLEVLGGLNEINHNQLQYIQQNQPFQSPKSSNEKDIQKLNLTQSQLDQSIYDINMELLTTSVKCLQSYQEDLQQLEDNFKRSGIQKLQIPNIDELQYKEPEKVITYETKASLQHLNTILKYKVKTLENQIQQVQYDIQQVLQYFQAMSRLYTNKLQ